jgi:oxygen-dependent protoporphyrinogen oxidase
MDREGPQVVVVGAGITGLACAIGLRKRGVRVLVLEGSERAGGKISTEERGGFQFECGPNTVLPNPALLELIEAAGLAGEIVAAEPGAKRRYVLRHGMLEAVPMGLAAALRSPLVGVGGLMSVAREALRGRGSPVERETVAAFIRRRFGLRILDNLVAPFVSGVYAGDAARLEARSVFPELVEAEERRGSVVRGMLAARRRAQRERGTAARHGSITLRRGLGSLARGLGEALGEDLRLNAPVAAIEEWADGCRVTLASGGVVRCERVVLSGEPRSAAALLKDVPDSAFIRRDLEGIDHAGLIVVGLGFPRSAVAHPLDGFGYLAGPGAEGPVIGSMFRSSLFPHSAPSGACLIVSFVRAHDRGHLVSDAEAGALARAALAQRLGVRGEPSEVFVSRWERAIAQPRPGHDAMRRRVVGWSERGRVSVISSAVHGVSLPKCAATGLAEGSRVARLVEGSHAPTGASEAHA